MWALCFALFQQSGLRWGAGVGPVDEFVEGVAHFFGGEGAVAFAVNVLLDEVGGVAGGGDFGFVEGEGAGRDKRVVDGVEREHGAGEAAGGRVVREEVGAGARVCSVATDAVVQGVVGLGVGAGAGVNEVVVGKGVAARFLLQVGDDVGVIADGAGDLDVGVEAGEVAHGGGAIGLEFESRKDPGAEGVALFKVGGDRVERRHDAGEVKVEGGAPDEAAVEMDVAGADGTAEIEAGGVGVFGVQLHGDHDERAAHAAAGGDGFARDAVLADEVVAQGFGVGVGGLEGPAGLRVAALEDGVAAAEHGFRLQADGAVEAVAEGALGVAVVEDDEVVVPVAGDVDAVFGIGENADLGDAGGGFEDFRLGGGGGCGLGVEARCGAQGEKDACGTAAERSPKEPVLRREHAVRGPGRNELRIRYAGGGG